jgi:hypothetical protein
MSNATKQKARKVGRPKLPTKMRQIKVGLSPELIKTLGEIALRNNEDQSAFCRRAIHNAILQAVK